MKLDEGKCIRLVIPDIFRHPYRVQNLPLPLIHFPFHTKRQGLLSGSEPKQKSADDFKTRQNEIKKIALAKVTC